MIEGEATRAVREPLEPQPGPEGSSGAVLRGWKLGAPIGRGGSSVVFRATRADGSFRQRAAVKLLHAGGEGFVARFERERRILLELRHPHIVRLLDGGTTASGTPWYAMEYIEGEPITRWASGRPLAERLRAWVSVARAVAFAHRHLVVHCDLKPDNVLVDGEGAAHVLDFGIARLLDEDERTATLRLATPRWAAPEQVLAGPLTTATDVHGLGLLLWALVAGREPPGGPSGKAALEARRDPLPAPSRWEPAARGDLDAIVLRATALDPKDRYASASALADDLERHLSGEAVLAREGVAWYRASRWVRRHRALVAGAGLALALVVGWGSTFAVQARRVRAQRDRAEATLALLVDMLEAADPAQARGEDLTVREVLDRGVQQLDLAGRDPAVAGEVRLAVGRVQKAVGDTPAAHASFQRAAEELARVHPPDHPSLLRARLHQAFAQFALDEDRDGALARVEDLAARFDGLGEARDAAQAQLMLADMRAEHGAYEAATRAAAEARRRLLDLGEKRLAARALAVDGYARVRMGQPEEGERRMRQALDETVAAVGTRKHPDVLDILHELVLASPEPDPAAYEELLALRREVSGETWALVSALNNFGLYLEKRDPGRAAAVLAEASEVAARSRGPGHPAALGIALNHGAVLIDTGRLAEGLAVLDRIEAHGPLPANLAAGVKKYRGRAEARRAEHAGP